MADAKSTTSKVLGPTFLGFLRLVQKRGICKMFKKVIKKFRTVNAQQSLVDSQMLVNFWEKYYYNAEKDDFDLRIAC